MIKLLMVDDEPLVLAGLQSMIPWETHGIEICSTARNGALALEIIGKERPDIVIADIMMPLMSGLELMDFCKEKYGRIPLFIILTSVEEYGYVKQAISGQAMDYLVKLELTPEKLLETINKAKDVLRSLGRTQSATTIEHGMQFLYDRFFTGLFTNQIKTNEQFAEQAEKLKIDLSYDSFSVCCCRLEGASANTQDTGWLINLYSNTTKATYEVISQYMPCYIASIDLHQFAIIFCLNSQEAQDYQQLLQDVLEGVVSLVKNYFNVTLDCSVGITVSSPLLLSDSYHCAQKSMQNPERSRPIHFFQSDPKKSIVVEQVKDYIKENLHKRLTLSQVSDVFGYSPKYISLLFAKHAGHSFVEYINFQRIAQARGLLLDRNAKIYEIAEQLGFENAFYFSKVFKKVEGISPREYIKKNTMD